MMITFFIQMSFKGCAIIYFNIHKSGVIIRFLEKNLKYDRNYSTNVKLFLIMLTWSIASFILIIINLMSIEAFISKGSLHACLSLSIFYIITWFFWIITFTPCIFSLIYNDRLDKIMMNIMHNVNLSSKCSRK